MSSKVILSLDDVKGATWNLPFSEKNTALQAVIQDLQTKKFEMTNTYVHERSNALDEMFSKITFLGTGFSFGLLKTRLSAQFLTGVQFIHPDLDLHVNPNDASSVLSSEKLKLASIDFNYILSLILGKMNLDANSLMTTFNMRMSKKISTTYDLSYMLTSNSTDVFGEITNFKMKGISVVMNEKLFDAAVQSEYFIYMTQDTYADTKHYNVNAEFKFNHSGPVDFSKLVDVSINRINAVTDNLLGGVNGSRN